MESGRHTWKVGLSELLFFFYDVGDSARQWFLCLLAWCNVAMELGGCVYDASVSANPLEVPLFKAGSRSRWVPAALKEAIAQEAHGPEGPNSTSKVAQTLERYGKQQLQRLIPGRWSAMSAVRLQCLRYYHSARELFNERVEFLSLAFDGTRLGKKDVLQIALTSPDTDKAVFGPPQAWVSEGGGRRAQKGRAGRLETPFPAFRKMSCSAARKNSTFSGNDFQHSVKGVLSTQPGPFQGAEGPPLPQGAGRSQGDPQGASALVWANATFDLRRFRSGDARGHGGMGGRGVGRRGRGTGGEVTRLGPSASDQQLSSVDDRPGAGAIHAH